MAALGEPVRLERGECGGSRGRSGWGGSRLGTALPAGRSGDKVAATLTLGTPPRPPRWALLAGGAGWRLKARQTQPFTLTVGTARFGDLPTPVGTDTPWRRTAESAFSLISPKSNGHTRCLGLSTVLAPVHEQISVASWPCSYTWRTQAHSRSHSLAPI